MGKTFLCVCHCCHICAFLIIKTICVYVCISVWLCIQEYSCPQRPKEGDRFPETEVTGPLGTTQHGYWEPRCGSLQGQHTCSTPKTFLQSISRIFQCGKKVRQIFGPVECSASCWRGSSQRRKDQMLLRKSPLVLIRLNKSAFNSRILSRIIQINLVN